MVKKISGKTLIEKHVRQSDHVLLINPPVEDTRYAWLHWNQPLDLLKIGAYLKQHTGCRVDLYDFMKPDKQGHVLQQRLPGTRQNRAVRGERYPMWRFGAPYSSLADWVLQQRQKKSSAPTQVWITSLCSYWFHGVAQVCREVKQCLPDARIVLIGTFPALMAEHAAEICPADTIVNRPVDLSSTKVSLDLYGNDLPTFCALKLRPKVAISEIKAAVKLGIFDFTFFEEDICQDDGELLEEVIASTETLHPRLKFHAICGLDPRKVTPRVARTLARNCFDEIHFEEAEDGDRLHVDAYKTAREHLREAGLKIPDRSISGFVWIGRPHETLDSIIHRSFDVLRFLGGFILKPFSPTPGSREYKENSEYLASILPQDLSPHVFPFAELNGITRADYHDLYRMAAFLNDRVRGQAFDFFDGAMGLAFLKESLRREVWKLEPSSLRVTH